MLKITILLLPWISAALLLLSPFVHAELKPLSELDLENTHAQAGIELDLDVQATIESIAYHDDDGVEGPNGAPGTAGVLALKGVHIGSSESPITAEMMQADRPFSETDLARIHNVLIEADPQRGMLINIEQLGDTNGNGLDIVVQNVVLGNESRSAGGILIEDLTNFIQDEKLAALNQAFSMQLASPDDGLETIGGNYIPIQTQIVTPEGNLSAVDLLQGNLEIGSEMTMSAAFAVHMDKVAWVDDGNEFGVAGLLVYQGLDTDNDGIDDQVGVAQLSNMSIKTVDHTNVEGETVQALHFSNIDFKADIAINSIYVGQPEQSLGSLHIKGLDTSGTAVWMYNH